MMADDTCSWEDLIQTYFDLGLEYKDILATLAVKHQIVLSERHLKRILKSAHLSRRKEFSDLGDVVLFIQNNMVLNDVGGNYHSYRWLHAKCLEHGLSVRKEDVRLI